MTERERLAAQNQQMIDQVWARLDARLGDVQRVALCGPAMTDADNQLVRVAFGLLTAELYHRRSQREV